MKAFGSNAHGQLGIGNTEDSCLPVDCIFGEHVVPKSVACGANHSLVVSTNDELWVSGLNDHGQIGLDVQQTTAFVKLKHEMFVNLEKVAAGWNHSLILLQNGQVYVLGSNEFGQCGSNDKSDNRIPKLVHGIPKLLSVICSLSTSYGLDNDGNIWGWGLNRYGELGIESHTQVLTPKCIIENYFAKEIACGQHHLLIHTLDGKILGMGSNKFGQLGTLDKRFFTFPCLIPIKEIPNQIFSGWNFSGCLTSGGNVYTWGRCDMGQLGFDPQFDQEKNTDSVKNVRIYPSPCLNISLKNISKVVAGSEFCLAIDNCSNCFSWGWNEHGNCGCGHNQNIFHPTHTTSGLRFIAAGYGFGFSCNE